MHEKFEEPTSGPSNRKHMGTSEAVPAMRPGLTSGSSNRKVVVSTAVQVTKSTPSGAKESK
jgi:hypothetical protein